MIRPRACACLSMLVAAAGFGQIVPGEGPTIPKDLAELIRSEFASTDYLECFAEEHVKLEEVLRSERLGLGPKKTEVFLVEGIGPRCLAGANNGYLAVFARIKGTWACDIVLWSDVDGAALPSPNVPAMRVQRTQTGSFQMIIAAGRARPSTQTLDRLALATGTRLRISFERV